MQKHATYMYSIPTQANKKKLNKNNVHKLHTDDTI